MGSKWSNSKKSAYARAAQYQKESVAAERKVSRSPKPLEWECPPLDCITADDLHNYLTDGFYAPFIINCSYLLLIDCRSYDDYENEHLITSHWHGNLSDNMLEKEYIFVILYNDEQRKLPPATGENTVLSNTFHHLRQYKMNPKIVVGGWKMINSKCKHLMEAKNADRPEQPITWFPSMIIPGFLYLGQSDMVSNRKVLTELKITHVITISTTVPRRVLLSTNYLIIPILEEKENIKNSLKKKDASETPRLATCYGTLAEFIAEAKSIGGAVLVHSDEGLASAAAIVMGLLMGEKECTLEDAFYYVQTARSAISPRPCLLDQLVELEKFMFGSSLTNVDDLF